MLLEEQRFLHEDLERLEQGISDRVADDPRQLRDRLSRDHQISGFLTRIQDQSKRLLEIYNDTDGVRRQEIQAISTGDPFDEFYKQLDEIKDFHRRYPNEPVENLERAYRKKVPGDSDLAAAEIDNMFTGEEAYGRFLDLTTLHEDYLNLAGVKRLTYLQYLDTFDIFTPPQCPIRRTDKTTDQYFNYVGALATYLEGFLRRTRPLEALDKLFASIDTDFVAAWDANEVPGWGDDSTSQGQAERKAMDESGDGIWCADCEKAFQNENVYRNHLSGKKHLRAVEARAAGKCPANGAANGGTSGASAGKAKAQLRLKERAVAEREYRVRRMAGAMQQQKSDTRVNVERKQGMTERERQMELDTLFAESTEPTAPGGEDESDSEGDEKIYNPLKLPLAWDGKPIPYWLYKLHGLGVELTCEICGNFVYMGRRAFDKHFNEARHIYGLKCLGITNTTLFREITQIEDALKLWDKIQRDQKKEKSSTENVVQMEDADGNVMPEKVYYDLQKQGLL
ncbi:MAG: hypothetical protein M1838_005390 [Thelocarpon superellum]|nr:MAG: hypothetical protein M1838_005390 [Thelocarpon superellum]